MKRPFHNIKYLLPIALTLLAPFALAGDKHRADILVQVQELYGYTEEQAVSRLAKEAEAIDAARYINPTSVNSYAGSWFDGDSWSLKVAIANRDDLSFVKRMGGNPILVQRSLAELEEARSALKSRMESDIRLARAIVRIALNPRINAIEVDFKNERLEFIEAAMIDAQIRDAILIRNASSLPVFSSGPLRGAVPTRNWTWGDNDPKHDFGDFPCSTGFAIESGYVTAGHCGYVGNEIVTPSGAALGTVQQSDWGPEDRGWVGTEPAWNPVPQVLGYGSGIFSIPAEWAGLDRVLIGNTVCRYGGTSGGPHCGTINAWGTYQNFNLPYNPWSININGLTEVNGSCSEPGDSGGSWVAAGTLQAQGTNIGVDPAVSTCQTGADRTFFWPVDNTTDVFSLNMLTSHGANAPSAYNLNCPDAANSGGGQFFCTSSFKSQGATDMTWTYGGNQSSGSWMFGTCSQGSTVGVGLTISNPYGTHVQNISFPCPSGPIP